MNIKMTIEVSPETALKVIGVIADADNSDIGAICEPTHFEPSIPANVSPTQGAPACQTVPLSFQQPTPAITPGVPTVAPSYTIEQLQTAIAPLLDAGKAPQIQQLVLSFGVNTLMDIPKERYGEFANGLRQLGGVL